MCFDVSIPIRLICSTDGSLCLRSATTSVWHTRCRRGPSTPTDDARILIHLRFIRHKEYTWTPKKHILELDTEQIACTCEREPEHRTAAEFNITKYVEN